MNLQGGKAISRCRIRAALLCQRVRRLPLEPRSLAPADRQRLGHGHKLGLRLRSVTLDDFYHRFEAVCALLLENADMFGYCYTQLTDIYPEENGYLQLRPVPKFDNARLRAIQQRIAAIEELERARSRRGESRRSEISRSGGIRSRAQSKR
jgi:hypothetical protein